MRRLVQAAAGGLILLGAALSGAARANPSMLRTFNLNHPEFISSHPFATTHVVIQVSEASPAVWTLALNNVENLLGSLGQNRIQIVVVAFGPGLRILLAGSPDAARIQAMSVEGVEFDACHNTMERMAKKLGHLPVLLPQAVIVPSGVLRIIQLETHGFTYIRP
ncbi:MAG: hypothetical protein M0002_17030 [Rhodospirillales bacterium]|nr:hypothetical protein [Rhodospirillales bacterium]